MTIKSVCVFDSHTEAEASIKELQIRHIDLQKLSIVGTKIVGTKGVGTKSVGTKAATQVAAHSPHELVGEPAPSVVSTVASKGAN